MIEYNLFAYSQLLIHVNHNNKIPSQPPLKLVFDWINRYDSLSNLTHKTDHHIWGEGHFSGNSICKEEVKEFQSEKGKGYKGGLKDKKGQNHKFPWILELGGVDFIQIDKSWRF